MSVKEEPQITGGNGRGQSGRKESIWSGYGEAFGPVITVGSEQIYSIPEMFPRLGLCHLLDFGKILRLVKKPQCYGYSDGDGHIGKIEDRPPPKIKKIHHAAAAELIRNIAARPAQRHTKRELGDAVLEEVPLPHNQADSAEKPHQTERQQAGIMP